MVLRKKLQLGKSRANPTDFESILRENMLRDLAPGALDDFDFLSIACCLYFLVLDFNLKFVG